MIELDIRAEDLAFLRAKAKKEDLSRRLETVQGSMLEMAFPRSSLDVIWAEGSIWIMGFETGLTQWRRLLRPGGFLVIHEMA